MLLALSVVGTIEHVAVCLGDVLRLRLMENSRPMPKVNCAVPRSYSCEIAPLTMA